MLLQEAVERRTLEWADERKWSINHKVKPSAQPVVMIRFGAAVAFPIYNSCRGTLRADRLSREAVRLNQRGKNREKLG